MPPFLFNRMQQPLCSFALPPPLPQLGSLPLTAGIQEMVMQRYQNPVAVFPFSSNWQMPQPMISSFSQVPQQQQQSLMPFSNFQPISAAPQSYLPAAPQFYAPPPPLPIPSAPQYSQPYMPPSYAMPSNQPVPYLPQPPMFPGSAAFPPALDYSSNSYAAICRACPPAPPSLGIPVQGHCWVQHCSACHHVPTPMAQPNVRPNGGRVTPLLRYPSVPQYVPDQTMYPQSDPHANAPVMMRPWLRKTPPLPPGAVIVSDHYVSRTPPHQRHQRPPKSYPRQSSRRQRSYTVTTASPVQTSNVPDRNTRIKSPVNQNQNNNNTAKRYEEPARSKSVSSTMSLSSSASAKSADYNKTTIYHSDPKEKVIPKQLAGEARSVNLKYNYQAQDLPSVYLINRYIKSSSEGSSLAPDLPESPVFSEKSHPNAPSPIDSNGAKEEKPRSSPRPPKTAMSKLIIIRESTTRSPSVVSTTSTLSSNAAFSILGKDSDTLSTTSTVKANLSKEEDNIVNEAVFWWRRIKTFADVILSLRSLPFFSHLEIVRINYYTSILIRFLIKLHVDCWRTGSSHFFSPLMKDSFRKRRSPLNTRSNVRWEEEEEEKTNRGAQVLVSTVFRSMINRDNQWLLVRVHHWCPVGGNNWNSDCFGTCFTGGKFWCTGMLTSEVWRSNIEELIDRLRTNQVTGVHLLREICFVHCCIRNRHSEVFDGMQCSAAIDVRISLFLRKLEEKKQCRSRRSKAVPRIYLMELSNFIRSINIRRG